MRKNRAGPRPAILAVLLAVAAAGASACGVCLEDKVAAVYDHAVVTGAMKRGHRVAFFALEGPLPADEESRRAVRRAIEVVAGIERRTVRVSLESASCSMAFDPARASVEAMAADLSRRLASRGITAAPLHLIAEDTRRRAD